MVVDGVRRCRHGVDGDDVVRLLTTRFNLWRGFGHGDRNLFVCGMRVVVDGVQIQVALDCGDGRVDWCNTRKLA